MAENAATCSQLDQQLRTMCEEQKEKTQLVNIQSSQL